MASFVEFVLFGVDMRLFEYRYTGFLRSCIESLSPGLSRVIRVDSSHIFSFFS